MSDPVPHNRNRLGWLLGFIFHPFTVFIPALVVVLNDTPRREALAWLTFIAVLLLGPTALLVQLARRRGRYVYQRETRHILYLTGELSILICTGLAIALEASPRLLFSLLTLALWVPLQYTVNARLTKISAHAAVISGIVAAFMVLGEIDSMPLALAGVGAVLATAWARVVTGHHTLTQVSLGIMVSITSVLAAAVLVSL
ncbi:MAG: hypothetical protein HY866_16530 [Chloroflexi bacterium]|nr:hypothetical protein [Chloroflexota bacterium]